MTTTQPTPRFGHHPDHIIDYLVEVECIQSMCTDHALTGQVFNDDGTPTDTDTMMRRLWRANGFRVGVVPEALAARRILVGCVRQMEAIYVQSLQEQPK